MVIPEVESNGRKKRKRGDVEGKMKEKRKKTRFKRLAVLGLLCCLVSDPVLTAEAAEGNSAASAEQWQPETDGSALSVEQEQPEAGGPVAAEGTAMDQTVSGADAGGSMGKISDSESLEGFGQADLSSMIYQAGGWGIPAEEYLIQPYSVTNEAALKADILNALRKGEKELDVRKYDMNVEDKEIIYKLVAAAINENPELYYGSAFIGWSYSGDKLVKLYFHYGDYSPEDKQLYAAKLQQATALVTSGMTDMEKALVLHDYLAQNCAYANDEYLAGTLKDHKDFYSAYGALAEGRAVCQGYALAYDALLQQVGIQGCICSSDEMNHAWNIILIDGNWYHVDVTWDDPVWNMEGRAGHEYFLLSDSEMESREHYGWNASVECKSTRYDTYWWRNVNSQIVVGGDSQYYYIPGDTFSITDADRGFRIKVRKGDAVSDRYSNQTVWRSENGGYYPTAYASLSGQGDYLYFNDDKNLYAMKLSGGGPEKIYTYTGANGSIWGAMVYTDGEVRLTIGTSPNRSDDSYITIDLRGPFPVLEADYTNKILPTTASMEYSLDGGIHWTPCADNMKLEAFGWNGSREVNVLVRYRSGSKGGFAGQTASVTLKTRSGTLSGTVKCPGNKAGQITVQILDGTGKVVCEAKISSGSNNFLLQNVVSGLYTMRVSRPAYVSREYPLAVTDKAVNRDVELCLLGDLNGDGRINAMDKRIIYNHMTGSVLTGYAFLVGDVDGNGEINARDKRMIYNHIAGTSLLWQ